MNTAPQQAGAKGTQSLSPLRPGRRFEILAKDFTSVEQAAPVTLVYGLPAPFAGIQITPIFGFRNQPITTDAGK